MQPGATPDGATLSRIEAILREQSGKPVTVSGPRTVAASGNVHTADEIRSLADAIGPPQGRDNTAVIYLLYMSGAFEKEGVLGVSVRGDTTAVFPSEIASAATPLVQ